MKTKSSVLGMLAAVLTFGIISAGCDNGTTNAPPLPPTEISTLADLQAINGNPANLSKNYILTADISGVPTIGSVSGNMVPFTGDFDGNGHIITVNITSGAAFSMGEYSGTYAGLFAGIGDGGSVHDLTVTGTVNVNITTSTNQVVGAGGVAGGMLPGASVSNVESSVNVSVTSSDTGDVFAGGIAGGVQGGRVSNSHATGNVSATSTATSGDPNVDVGGVVGGARDGVINRVYATGTVSGTANSNTNDCDVQAGGVIGTADEGTEVRNAYATGNVSAIGKSNVRAGGVAGNFHEGKLVEYVYATGSVSVTANGSAGGQASGVVGNFRHEGEVSHTVALNTTISITGSASSQSAHRVIGRTGEETGTMANNYGKTDLTPTVSQGTYAADVGADKVDGADVTASNASSQTWWTGTGFNGADWTKVWWWDDTMGLPKLR